MRTTVTLDETKLERAREWTGIRSNSELIRAALDVLLAREAAQRLARLGGSSPEATLPPRRRSALPKGAIAPEDMQS